ncbi:MAG: helix-turn-helix domain-containing protein [Marinisporobacter sp.]|nr:helix-turn-helix domain-containing protein [Marinisporobacter sp.]
MARPRILTPLEEQGVYQMHKEKKTIVEIAYVYKISPSTVHRIVRKIKNDIKEGEVGKVEKES